MADYIYRIVHRERGRVAFRTSLRSGRGNLLAEGNELPAKRRRTLGSSAMFRRDFFHGCLYIYIYIYIYIYMYMHVYVCSVWVCLYTRM